MPLIVEDGTGLTTANSLCSVNEAGKYFSDRGITTWTGSSSAKETALIRATDFLENRWGALFKGEKLQSTQALSFPRLYIDADNIVPKKVKWAVAEYALRTLQGTPLHADPTIDATGRQARRVKERLEGVVDTEVEYFGSSSQAPSYPAADMHLREYLRTGGRSYR